MSSGPTPKSSRPGLGMGADSSEGDSVSSQTLELTMNDVIPFDLDGTPGQSVRSGVHVLQSEGYGLADLVLRSSLASIQSEPDRYAGDSPQGAGAGGAHNNRRSQGSTGRSSLTMSMESDPSPKAQLPPRHPSERIRRQHSLHRSASAVSSSHMTDYSETEDMLDPFDLEVEKSPSTPAVLPEALVSNNLPTVTSLFASLEKELRQVDEPLPELGHASHSGTLDELDERAQTQGSFGSPTNPYSTTVAGHGVEVGLGISARHLLDFDRVAEAPRNEIVVTPVSSLDEEEQRILEEEAFLAEGAQRSALLSDIQELQSAVSGASFGRLPLPTAESSPVLEGGKDAEEVHLRADEGLHAQASSPLVQSPSGSRFGQSRIVFETKLNGLMKGETMARDSLSADGEEWIGRAILEFQESLFWITHQRELDNGTNRHRVFHEESQTRREIRRMETVERFVKTAVLSVLLHASQLSGHHESFLQLAMEDFVLKQLEEHGRQEIEMMEQRKRTQRLCQGLSSEEGIQRSFLEQVQDAEFHGIESQLFNAQGDLQREVNQRRLHQESLDFVAKESEARAIIAGAWLQEYSSIAQFLRGTVALLQDEQVGRGNLQCAESSKRLIESGAVDLLFNAFDDHSRLVHACQTELEGFFADWTNEHRQLEEHVAAIKMAINDFEDREEKRRRRIRNTEKSERTALKQYFAQGREDLEEEEAMKLRMRLLGEDNSEQTRHLRWAKHVEESKQANIERREKEFWTGVLDQLAAVDEQNGRPLERGSMPGRERTRVRPVTFKVKPKDSPPLPKQQGGSTASRNTPLESFGQAEGDDRSTTNTVSPIPASILENSFSISGGLGDGLAREGLIPSPPPAPQHQGVSVRPPRPPPKKPGDLLPMNSPASPRQRPAESSDLNHSERRTPTRPTFKPNGLRRTSSSRRTPPDSEDEPSHAMSFSARAPGRDDGDRESPGQHAPRISRSFSLSAMKHNQSQGMNNAGSGSRRATRRQTEVGAVTTPSARRSASIAKMAPLPNSPQAHSKSPQSHYAWAEGPSMTQRPQSSSIGKRVPTVPDSPQAGEMSPRGRNQSLTGSPDPAPQKSKGSGTIEPVHDKSVLSPVAHIVPLSVDVNLQAKEAGNAAKRAKAEALRQVRRRMSHAT